VEYLVKNLLNYDYTEAYLVILAEVAKIEDCLNHKLRFSMMPGAKANPPIHYYYRIFYQDLTAK
jgi:hypothetical protein